MQVLRLWEALWSAHLTPHFHLYVAAGVLGLHRRAIMEVRMLRSHTQVCSLRRKCKGWLYISKGDVGQIVMESSLHGMPARMATVAALYAQKTEGGGATKGGSLHWYEICGLNSSRQVLQAARALMQCPQVADYVAVLTCWQQASMCALPCRMAGS